MVSNKLIILDESQLKYMPEANMAKPRHIIEYEEKLFTMNYDFQKYDHFVKSLKAGWIIENKQNYDKHKDLLEKIKAWKEDIHIIKYLYDDHIVPKKHWWDARICSYMNVIPFTPSVMINISPAWKDIGQARVNHEYMIELLRKTIELYLGASNRYDYYSYVIECGADGDHIHAHIVAHINPDIIKSVETHINKGNHNVELRKIFKKVFNEKTSLMKPKGKKGINPDFKGGVLSGKYAIQRILLRNEELVSDKIEYLEEEKKPVGHKNARHPICPLLVVFTSKDQQA